MLYFSVLANAAVANVCLGSVHIPVSSDYLAYIHRSLHRLSLQMLLPAQDGRRGAADIFGVVLFLASLFELISLSTDHQERNTKNK